MRFASPRRLISTSAALAALLLLGTPLAGQDALLPGAAGTQSQPAEASSSPADDTAHAPTPAQAAPTAEETAPAAEDTAPTAKQSAPAAEATAPTPATKGPAPADEPLTPTPDPISSGAAAFEPASFKGVLPGKTTADEVAKAWGAPKEIRKQGQVLMHLFTVEPFKRVEVSYFQDTVISVVIRFDRTFPANSVAQQLELTSIRPVLISDDLGNVQGQVYPERGVLFAFTPSDDSGKPTMEVSHIILEPITAEPFLLRAETSLDADVETSLADVRNALAMEPGNARAHWLHARLLLDAGEAKKAVEASAEAVRLDPGNPEYHVTRARVLAHTGKLTEAVAEAKKAVEVGDQRPHIKARALCLLGDLTASGTKPNYAQAIQYHTEAVRTADPLALNAHPAIRVAAKEVLIDAHLGAAHDIAWGSWKDKETAVARWLELAEALAKDFVRTEGGTEKHAFRVAARALAIGVGLRGKLDPERWTANMVRLGEELIAAAEPAEKERLKWELGVALYDALQVYEMRGDHEAALKYGERAIEYLETSSRRNQVVTADYLLGRLYFRMGSIQASRNKNHRLAISWYDKAVPLLKRPVPGQFFGELGRHGQTFVSMGVSYWQTGQRDNAVDLTQFGIALMEEAVRQGTLGESSLSIPYGNLAAMHGELGAEQEAQHYQALAEKYKNTTTQ